MAIDWGVQFENGLFDDQRLDEGEDMRELVMTEEEEMIE